MSPAFRDLWRWKGTIERGPYALIGVLGFAIKHNLDRLVARLFGKRWGIYNYWIPPHRVVRPSSLSHAEAEFLAAMVLLALPFIWVGVALTLRRLRSIGAPPWLVVLFFFPFLNLAFFLLLCLLPSRAEAEQMKRERAQRTFLGQYLPRGKWGSAAVAVAFTAILGVLLTLFSVKLLATYGWTLFLAVPFCLGLFSSFLYGYHQPRSLGSCLLVASLSVFLLGLALFAVAFEGLICLAMAVPLAIPLVLLGALFGYWIQRRPAGPVESAALIVFALLVSPILMGAEAANVQIPPVYEVMTSLDIQAPPEVVWRHVVEFTQIPEPREWYFRMGIAYPVRAEMHGNGPGAIRQCVFSTGPFVEPIEVWDEPRLLRFSVTETPAPLQEWSAYSGLHPPHLRGYFVSRGGQFRLIPVPGGKTRLEGTTWYRHAIWPKEYWRLWSDAIIHRIHFRVLQHIQRVAEAQQAARGQGVRPE